MTSSSSNMPWQKFAAFALTLAVVACATLAILVGLNIERVDSIVGAIIKWDGGSGTYIACYEDFLLTANRDEFFKFSSGRGRNSLAGVRIQFADGNVVSLPQLTPDAVLNYFPKAEKSILPIRGLTVVRYGIGFDSFDFVDSELEGITLSEHRQIAIDFGDGQFVRLPVERKKLLNLLGPPKAWEKVTGGPP